MWPVKTQNLTHILYPNKPSCSGLSPLISPLAGESFVWTERGLMKIITSPQVLDKAAGGQRRTDLPS